MSQENVEIVRRHIET